MLYGETDNNATYADFIKVNKVSTTGGVTNINTVNFNDPGVDLGFNTASTFSEEMLASDLDRVTHGDRLLLSFKIVNPGAVGTFTVHDIRLQYHLE